MIKACYSCLGAEGPPHQMVMLGLEGVGKTTLLYRLKIPTWKSIAQDMGRLRVQGDGKRLDPGYHYEEFHGRLKLRKYGIWDVPGNEVMVQMWPTFYRYIRVTAVLFVVDGSDKSDQAKEKLSKARGLIDFLLNEDELRLAAFMIIINVHKEAGDQPVDKAHIRESIGAALNVTHLLDQDSSKSRVRMLVLDCANVSVTDKEWKHLIEEIHRIYISVGAGSIL
mmetsp:Transcript_56790/g.122768  ORF Transcript_56790/g.122768 Transcript_56790/m.122768 type:complete len:223 (+) Transcript_56790:128-796(+)